MHKKTNEEIYFDVIYFNFFGHIQIILNSRKAENIKIVPLNMVGGASVGKGGGAQASNSFARPVACRMAAVLALIFGRSPSRMERTPSEVSEGRAVPSFFLGSPKLPRKKISEKSSRDEGNKMRSILEIRSKFWPLRTK